MISSSRLGRLLWLASIASVGCSLPEISPSPDASRDAAPRDAVDLEDAWPGDGSDGDVVPPGLNCGLSVHLVAPVSPGSCVFALPSPPASHLSRSSIDVLFDGSKLAMNETSGWVYADPELQNIELRGEVCAAYQENPDLVVAIVFRCLLW